MKNEEIATNLRNVNMWIHVLQGIVSLIKDEDWYYTCANEYFEQTIRKIGQHYGCQDVWLTWRQKDNYEESQTQIQRDIETLRTLKQEILIEYAKPVSRSEKYVVFQLAHYKAHLPIYLAIENKVDLQTIQEKEDNSVSTSYPAINLMFDKLSTFEYFKVTIDDIKESYFALLSLCRRARTDVKSEER